VKYGEARPKASHRLIFAAVELADLATEVDNVDGGLGAKSWARSSRERAVSSSSPVGLDLVAAIRADIHQRTRSSCIVDDVEAPRESMSSRETYADSASLMRRTSLASNSGHFEEWLMNGSLAVVLATVDHMAIWPLASRIATCLRTLAMDFSNDASSLALPVESVGHGMVSSMGASEAAEVLAVAWRVVAGLIRGSAQGS
jgi:hypothetical protein